MGGRKRGVSQCASRGMVGYRGCLIYIYIYTHTLGLLVSTLGRGYDAWFESLACMQGCLSAKLPIGGEGGGGREPPYLHQLG